LPPIGLLNGAPEFLRRIAGRVEMGEPSVSDPAMDLTA